MCNRGFSGCDKKVFPNVGGNAVGILIAVAPDLCRFLPVHESDGGLIITEILPTFQDAEAQCRAATAIAVQDVITAVVPLEYRQVINLVVIPDPVQQMQIQ
ncbi:hypothetical protein RW64_01525 [Geobacter sulfurreducens]|nr:hypothetical protein RW64_01525 [Geobacter sulfurreducens]